MLGIIAYNDEDNSGIEPVLLYLEEELNDSKSISRKRMHSGKQNNDKYTDRWSNGVVTRRAIMNKLEKLNIDFTSTLLKNVYS